MSDEISSKVGAKMMICDCAEECKRHHSDLDCAKNGEKDHNAREPHEKTAYCQTECRRIAGGTVIACCVPIAINTPGKSILDRGVHCRQKVSIDTRETDTLQGEVVGCNFVENTVTIEIKISCEFVYEVEE